MASWKDRVPHLGLLWLRVLMGAGIASHGFAKVFGGRMDQFAQGVGQLGLPLPGIFAWAAALSEFCGGLLIVLGLATRPAAFFVFCTMAVAAFMRHAADPFGVKELALAYGTVACALMFTGAGAFSLDALFRGKKTFRSAG